MNILQLQERLKDLPDNALMQEMQMPTGNAPQFLVLSELKRRKRMRDEYKRQEAADMPTVAEEVVTAAGMPQEGIMGAARAVAPNTNVAQNTGMDVAAPVPATRAPQPQMMADGGVLRYAPGGAISAQPTGEGGTYILMQDGEKIPGTGTYPDFRSANEAARAIRDVPAFQRSRVLSGLGQPEPILETEVSALSQVDPDAMAFAANDDIRRQLQLRQARGQRDDPSVGGIASLDPLGRAFMDEYRPDMSVASSQEGIPEFGDAPYAQTNLADLLEEMTKANEGIARDELPASANDDLRFSRGTASLDAVKDPLTDYQRMTDRYGFPFDSTLKSADRLFDKGTASVNAPSLATDAPDPLQGLSLADQMIALGFTGGDIDPTRFPTAEEKELAGQISAIDAFGDYLVSPKMGPDAPQVAETTEDSVTTDSEPYRGPVSGMTLSEKFADPVEATRRLFGFGASEDTATTQNEASVVDTAATEDLVTEEAKVESGDKKAPPIRPKLRPDDLLSPTSPRGPSGPSGLSGADLSIASMLEARKKEAEADKWMALAYAGMELMKPTATIGEGLGKAGQAGLGYLTKSKKGLQDFETDMLKLQTQRDIANIRAAASGSRSGNKLPTGSSLMTYLSGKLEDLAGQRFIAAQQKDAQALTRIDAEMDEVERQIAEVVDTGTFSSGRNNNNGNDVVRDYDVNK